jgi:hypothetical protein
MRLNSALPMAALAFGLMSGVALAEQDYVVPDGVTLMTEDEIRDKIIENTLGGNDYGKKWFEYYKEDGKIKGIWDRDRYRGKWTLEGPVMCFDYAGSGYDGCWTISLDDDDTVHWYKPTGELDDPEPPDKRYDGNPKGL